MTLLLNAKTDDSTGGCLVGCNSSGISMLFLLREPTRVRCSSSSSSVSVMLLNKLYVTT